VIACLALAKCAANLKVRDRYLAWSEEARERNVHLLAYNTRFLILPWVQVEHLASHLLGRMAAGSARLQRPTRILFIVGDVCRYLAFSRDLFIAQQTGW